MELGGLAQRIDSTDVDLLDAAGAEALLGDLRLVVTAAEMKTAAVHARLVTLAQTDPKVDPERINSRATRRPESAARRDRTRAETIAKSPGVADAVASGMASIEHADVVAAAARRLDAERRTALFEHPRLGRLAAGSTAPEFRRGVDQLVRDLQTNDGLDQFEQHRAGNRFSCKPNPGGMYRLSGMLDPEQGTLLAGKVDARVEALFHDARPDGCPDDPIERQEFLRALALLDLLHNPGPGGVVEMSIVVDIDTLRHGCNEHSLIEFGPDGAIVPLATLRRYLCLADVSHILFQDGVALAMGRERRTATREQRRMARAMYPRCAIAGCETAFERCELHHVIWWRNLGRTDLDNLVPLCSRHHHAAHEGGWHLDLHPETRVLTVTYPDGSTEAMPPPRARPAATARPCSGAPPGTEPPPRTKAPPEAKSLHEAKRPPDRRSNTPPGSASSAEAAPNDVSSLFDPTVW